MSLLEGVYSSSNEHENMQALVGEAWPFQERLK